MVRNKFSQYFIVICFSFFCVNTLQAQTTTTKEYPVITIDGEDFYQYQVEKAEGFLSLERKFGVTQEELLKHNPQLKNGLKLDQIIFVPIKKKETTVKTEPTKTVTFGQNTTKTEPVTSVAPEKKANKSVKLNFIEHEVQKKETVFGISRLYYISVDSIYKYNPESVVKLKKGTVLKLPVHAIQVDEIKRKQEEDKLYNLHQAEEKETVYGIAKEYDLTVNDLLELNPDLKVRQLRKGDVIRISLKGKTNKLPADTITELSVDEPSTALKPVGEVIKVAFLLPFMLDASKPDPAADKFIDFYQGALIAIDSLKNAGVSMDIYTFDTDRSIEKINKILTTPELKGVDLIIGPAYTPHVKPVAEFAKQNKIRMVVPFSAKTEETFVNPYIYQSNIHQDILDEETAKVFASRFKDDNIIIFGFADNAYAGLLSQLTKSLAERNVSYSSKIVSNDSIQHVSIDPYWKAEKENIVLLMTTNPATLARMMPVLNKTSNEFALFGFMEWTQLSKTQEEIFIHDTYIASPFYLDYSKEYVKKFLRNYTEEFGSENSKSIPHYNMLGYDITFFFIDGLSKFGDDFEDSLKLIDSETLQMGFDFEKLNENGGFMNKNVFLIKYSNGNRSRIE